MATDQNVNIFTVMVIIYKTKISGSENKGLKWAPI